MKRLMLSLSLLFALFTPMLVAAPAFAADAVPGCTDPALQQTDVCREAQRGQNAPKSPIVGFIDTIIKIVSYVIGVAAIFGIIVSGLRMIIANGDPGAIKKAREGLIYSLVGVGIAVAAQSIVIFVLSKL
jgi:hypothetical protein